MATTTPWLDLSAYGLRLHVIAAPGGRPVMYVTGPTDAHQRALIALGFQRTPGGHIVKPDGKLAAAAALAQFPAARLRELPLADVVRQVNWTPRPNASGAGFAPSDESPPSAGGPGVVRPQDLPDALSALVERAANGERLDSADLRQFATRLHLPWNSNGLTPGFLHQLQEALEVAAVRTIAPTFQSVQADLRAGRPLADAAFRAAVALTEGLPRQRYRSERTVQLAQYSTPLPLALAAQALLGPVGAGRTVLEPTAGHGALVCGLPEDVAITAIELDPGRADRLRRALPAMRVLAGDAFALLGAAEPAYDYVIANPPFGSLQPMRDQFRATVTVAGAPFTTQRLDHALLLHGLRQRHPAGRAVFILAAEHPRDHALERPDGGSRYLFNFLADHFEVEAVIGVHGDLYGQHGAHYPVRLVVVGAQGPGFAPVPDTVPVVATWDELWRMTCAASARLGPSRRERLAPVAAPADPAPDEPAAAGPAETPAPDPLDASPAEDEPVVYQVRYEARSRIGEPITMIPANMALASRRALDRVEQRHGPSVDAFVARALGRDRADLESAFSPEQVDALALALHALHQGRGFIEADETGIGKGRVLAGLAQWAWRERRLVLFLTEKPNLFSDFYRDLTHTGGAAQARPVILNEGVAIKDTERGHTLLRPTLAGELRRWIDAGALPPNCNLVLATYSQINRPWSQCPKARWLLAIAERERPLVIADESHNAAGGSNTFENVRALVAAASGVVFSSATYAKRPDNLELYAPVLPAPYRRDCLTELLQAGGAPLQEVFSQMLAEDGVLVRREHDLSQIAFRTAPDRRREARNRDLADRLAGILEQMAYLGGDIQAMINEENQRLAEALGDSDERRGARAGLQSMNFGSRLYQLNRLFLLALKVDHAVEFGLGELQAGRKPVFVLEHTLETLLREVITNRFDDRSDAPGDDDPPERPAAPDPQPTTTRLPLEDGAPEPGAAHAPSDTYPALHFRDALQRVLDRMMTLTRRDRYGGATQEPIHAPELWALHAHISRQIARFPDLELSPLDRVRQSLEQHGYRCGELSGTAVLAAARAGRRRRGADGGPAAPGGGSQRSDFSLQHRSVSGPDPDPLGGDRPEPARPRRRAGLEFGAPGAVRTANPAERGGAHPVLGPGQPPGPVRAARGGHPDHRPAGRGAADRHAERQAAATVGQHHQQSGQRRAGADHPGPAQRHRQPGRPRLGGPESGRGAAARRRRVPGTGWVAAVVRQPGDEPDSVVPGGPAGAVARSMERQLRRHSGALPQSGPASVPDRRSRLARRNRRPAVVRGHGGGGPRQRVPGADLLHHRAV